MKSVRLLMAAVAAVLLWSCGRGDSTEVWQKERDNVVDVEVVSIEDSLPAMHSHSCPILVLGDTIIFKDIQSAEFLYAAYDVGTGRFLGWFGRYGGGPGEVANFGGEFLDAKNRIMYGHSYAQWNYAGFELDKAIGDPDYKAFVKVKNPTDESKLPTNCYRYVNDTTVIGAVRVPNEDWTAFTFRLGSLDLNTGLTTLLPNPPVEEGARYQIDVSPEHDLIVATGLENDRVNLYDLKGNLKKSIYGANYRPEIRKKRYYNCAPMITDDRIYFVYRRLRQWEYGDDIIELDHDGNYIRTLRTGVPIAKMVYHKGTNRIYFGSIADPQFGYIQL